MTSLVTSDNEYDYQYDYQYQLFTIDYSVSPVILNMSISESDHCESLSVTQPVSVTLSEFRVKRKVKFFQIHLISSSFVARSSDLQFSVQLASLLLFY